MKDSAAALAWYDAGFSVIHILADGSKKPKYKWEPFMGKPIPRQMVSSWLRQEPDLGIGIICGQVSGNLEMTELEGRAVEEGAIDRVTEAAQRLGIDWLWDLLTKNEGYAEWTPSGGIHLLYRISDHPVPGNVRIASRPARRDELDDKQLAILADRPDKTFPLVLAETRGEGGYVVVAPSDGTVHKSGDSWSVAVGEIGKVPTITWEDRCALHQAIADALDETPEPVYTPPANRPIRALAPGEVRPGDDFNSRTNWDEILVPHGWSVHHMSGPEVYWTRPGKDRRDGWSACSGHQGSDNLYVFSSSTDFEPECSYTKFAAYTILEHRGDYTAATRELSRRGFGTGRQSTDPDAALVRSAVQASQPTQNTAAMEPAADAATSPGSAAPVDTWRRDWAKPTFTADTFTHHAWDQLGMSDVYAEVYENKFKYIAETRKWRFWDGKMWAVDNKERHEDAARVLMDAARVDARRRVEAGEDLAEEFKAFVGKARSGTNSIIPRNARSHRTIAASPDEFDTHQHLITCDNGVIDLKAGTFGPLDPKLMLTRKIHIKFDPAATCPKWLAFLEIVQPEKSQRDLLQKMLSVPLLGQVGTRRTNIFQGRSGSGKSVCVRMGELVYGDFGDTAEASTFTAAGRGAQITNNLNELQGKRFVAISELDEGEQLNESLLKRLSGGDSVKSRGLYQENRRWRAEFEIFLAVNDLPRISSDDDAVWRRIKLLHFPVVLAEAGIIEILDYADKMFAEEAPGILNWFLGGVRKYLAEGITDTDAMTRAVEGYREEVDTVAQFVREATDERLVVRQSGLVIGARQLHSIYIEWCRRNGIKWFSERRFKNRLLSLHFTQKPAASGNVWVDIGLGIHGTLGTM